MIVDSHLHLWDPGRYDYSWLAGEDPSIRRAYTPSDVDTEGVPVDGFIVVEAGAQPPEAEVPWLASLHWPGLRGIVAQAPLERGAAVAPFLDSLTRHPLVVGVRRNVQNEAPGFLSSDEFVAGMRLCGDAGLSVDACVRHHQLAELRVLVEACPGVTFVLDHLGKPDIAAGYWQRWADDLAALAAHSTVYAKLSGLTTESGPDWHVEQLRPYLEHALEVFGPQRCMFGSDWPVATVTTGYAAWFEVVSAGLSGSERDEVLGGSALRAYRLT